jgi:hypothetical protein
LTERLTAVGATELELLLDELAGDDVEDELELLGCVLELLGCVLELVGLLVSAELLGLLSLLLDELVLGSTVEEVSAGPELGLLLFDGVVPGLQAPKTMPIVIASVRKAIFFLLFIRFSFLALCKYVREFFTP